MKCFVLKFLKCSSNKEKNSNKKENDSTIKSVKSNDELPNSYRQPIERSSKTKFYQFDENKLIQIIENNQDSAAKPASKPIIKIQHNNDIKQVTFQPKQQEGLELKIKNLSGDKVFNKRIDHYKCPNQYEYYVKTPSNWEKNKNSIAKSNFNDKNNNHTNDNHNNISSPPKESNDLELINLLNKFMFYVFLIFIISLNLFGLYIFPYLIKKPLTIEE